MKIENLTPHLVTHSVGRTALGQEALLFFVKAAFTVEANGHLLPVGEIPPFLASDEFTGEAGTSSLRFAAETCPPKPMVDVCICGSLQLPEPKTVVDCTLAVGSQFRKTVRVWGPRVWRKTNNQLAASAPQSFTSMPLHWEKAFGGVSARDPKIFESRNPLGVGLYDSRDAEGLPLPNFEAPDAPTVLGTPSAPVGLGAVSPHWSPRSKYAGTYDQAWQEQRAPLPPADFNSRFHNVAPEDQQLARYPAGETISLTNMTSKRQLSFVVPEFAFPVSFADNGYLVEREARPDTIVIDLDRGLVILRAALEYVLRDTVLDVAAAFVGVMSAEQRTALMEGTPYVELTKTLKGVA
jgi:hypothetical protein